MRGWTNGAMHDRSARLRPPAIAFMLAVALAVAAGPMVATAADWNGGGLPPSIAKARPSASVPADIPGSRVDTCRLLGAVTVYRPVGHGAIAGVVPSDVLSAGNGSGCGAPAPAPYAAPRFPPEGGGLPFGTE
ncbi:MAG: hypothetical protein ABTQ30_09175 [Rhizobiaceae bacterium]